MNLVDIIGSIAYLVLTRNLLISWMALSPTMTKTNLAQGRLLAPSAMHHSYAEMLDRISKLNEKRFGIIKTLTKLQDSASVSKYSLRNGRSGVGDVYVVVVKDETASQSSDKRSHKVIARMDNNTSTSDEIVEKPKWKYKNKWEKLLSKEMIKRCKKVCKSVLEQVCDNCNKVLKQKFKSNYKFICKRDFKYASLKDKPSSTSTQEDEYNDNDDSNEDGDDETNYGAGSNDANKSYNLKMTDN